MTTAERAKNDPIRMLLVEDDRESGFGLKAMLERRDVEVQIVSSGEKALEVLSPDRHDIVVADIRLGGMSGVEMLKRIRDAHPELPVILITGYDSLDSAIEAIRFGAQDYILKPIDTVEDLLAPSRRAVHSYRLYRQNCALVKELEAAESKFRSVLENSVDTLFRLNLQTQKTDYISPACERISGYSSDFLTALSFDQVVELLHPADQQRGREFFATVGGFSPEDGPLMPWVFRFRRKGGVYLWGSMTQSLVFDSAGKPAAVVGTVRDVTTEKEAEERERHLRERLARAERLESIGLLAGGVAHDLNNILTTIVGIPDVMLMDLEDAPDKLDVEQLRKDAESLLDAGNNAAAIIRDLLNLGRRGNFKAVPLNVNHVLTEYFDSASFLDLERLHPEVTIERKLAADLLPICGSAAHLSQVLMNLAINAVEAMPDGGCLTMSTRNQYVDRPCGSYELIEEGDYVVLRVDDTGAGIENDHIEKIFEPFYSKKKMGLRSGSGLGLAVVYGIVKDHNGYVDIETKVGVGTSFFMYFPVSHEAPLDEAVSSGVSVGDETILVVDDIEQQRRVAQRLLAKVGYNVETCAGGQEAVTLFQRLSAREDWTGSPPYDLVIVDMIMEEGIDGLDTFRGIRSICPDQKCIIVSGYAETERVKEALAAGAGQFVQKPYRLENIARAVRRELDQ